MADIDVTIAANGPILVKGPVTLHDSDGNAYDLGGKETIALCRCGQSANKPFCDGAHRGCGFESKVSAS